MLSGPPRSVRPLSSGEVLNNGAATAGSDRAVDSWEGGEEELMATGSDWAHLHFLLTGSASASPRWRRRLWASSILWVALGSSVLVVAATDPIWIGASSAWRRLGYAASMIWPACGWIATEVTILMAETLPTPLDSTSAQADHAEHLNANARVLVQDTPGSARHAKDRFMESLVNARVTPRCAARVGPYARRATVGMLGPFGMILYFILVMGTQLSDAQYTGYTVAMVCACLSVPSAWLQLSGWLVYLQVPSAIGCDLIWQSTRHVQRLGKGPSRSWNQVMTHLQSAHETSLCLSALLSPVIIANMLISGGMIALWFGAVLAPRTKLPEGSWVLVWVPQWVLHAAMICFYVNAILPLFVGARCSRACDELVDAIASLR